MLSGIDWTVRFPPSSLMSATTTFAPCSANSLAMPAPQPEPAPKTLMYQLCYGGVRDDGATCDDGNLSG